MKINALSDYITVELIDEPTKLILTEKPISPKGRVTSVGKKVRDIKVGDVIYYRARSSHSWRNQDFIRAEEVLAIEE
jgi:hypothetical protein